MDEYSFVHVNNGILKIIYMKITYGVKHNFPTLKWYHLYFHETIINYWAMEITYNVAHNLNSRVPS